MDSLNIVSCGFLKEAGGYSVPGILTFGFLELLGGPGIAVLDIFKVLRTDIKVVKMADQKNLDLRERKFRI